MSKTIPLVDLDQQYKNIKKDIDKAIAKVIKSKKFIQGEYATKFENQFANLHHAKYSCACSNGTTALSTVLEACKIGKGDEVITTPHTFIATVEAICHVGARPVFVDINPQTYNINASKITKRITKKTKVILPVHLYGHPADMLKINFLAKKYKLLVIEDCAQAHLASINQKPVGNFGIAGTFSFYPGKNLGAYGDAGMIISKQKKLITRCKMLINHGRKDKYLHQIIGYNHRMDGLQAAILSAKIKHLKKWTKQRQDIASKYNHLLKKHTRIITPIAQNNNSHVYHQYVVQINNRNHVANQLKSKGILCGIHYPIPLHLQPALKHLGYKKGDFPVTEKACSRILSLPIYPEMKNDEIKFVTENLIKFS